MPTVREAVVCLLRELGMTTVFGNPGSTEQPFFREFPDDFRYVLGLQEAVVIGMADGYAQATRNAALVNLHSAAGVGHAMGNIFTAYRNRTPLVITAGQQARSILPYEPFLFATQATKLPEPYVKWSSEPARGEDVPGAIARAYHIAMQAPCGPTFVSIPVDDWDRTSEPIGKRTVSRTSHPDPELIATTAERLDRSTKPAFVVGPGVDRNDAGKYEVRLEDTQLPALYISPYYRKLLKDESVDAIIIAPEHWHHWMTHCQLEWSRRICAGNAGLFGNGSGHCKLLKIAIARTDDC